MTVFTTNTWVNGFWLDFDGGDGDDYLSSRLGDPSYVWGSGGADKLLGTKEDSYLLGGYGDDALRTTNPLFLGRNRYAFGDWGADCLESDVDSLAGAGGVFTSVMDCGYDNDTASSWGNATLQTKTSCEATTANHCVCLPARSPCQGQGNSACCSNSCIIYDSNQSYCSSFYPRSALFVVGNVTLSVSDQAVANRLSGVGFSVVVKLDATVVSSDGNLRDLIVVSESVSAANVGAKFLSAASPVINCDPALQDDFNMTGTTWMTDQGTVTGTQVNVVALGQLANGLSGSTTVASAASTLVWGVPDGSPTIISRVVGSSTQATSYKYDKGAALRTGVAAGKRAMFFDYATTAANHTASGWALFDALVDWAAP